MTRIELFYFEGCPHAVAARVLIQTCLDRIGLTIPVEEHKGDYPSPTVLVDGEDVMGAPAQSGRCCRIDVPTSERLTTALRALQS